MKKSVVIAIITLLFVGGCDAIGVAYLPKQTLANETAAANKLRLRDLACAGTVSARCVRYRNELGPGKTILALLVNGKPKMIQAIGPGKPAGELRPREEMFVGLGDCEVALSDESGRRFCQDTVVAYAYSTETLGFVRQVAGSDQLLQDFIDIPHIEEETCYAMTINRYDEVQDDPISHNSNGDGNRPPCPQPRRELQVAAK
jgi:hypothetical protein